MNPLDILIVCFLVGFVTAFATLLFFWWKARQKKCEQESIDDEESPKALEIAVSMSNRTSFGSSADPMSPVHLTVHDHMLDGSKGVDIDCISNAGSSCTDEEPVVLSDEAFVATREENSCAGVKSISAPMEQGASEIRQNSDAEVPDKRSAAANSGVDCRSEAVNMQAHEVSSASSRSNYTAHQSVQLETMQIGAAQSSACAEVKESMSTDATATVSSAPEIQPDEAVGTQASVATSSAQPEAQSAISTDALASMPSAPGTQLDDSVNMVQSLEASKAGSSHLVNTFPAHPELVDDDTLKGMPKAASVSAHDVLPERADSHASDVISKRTDTVGSNHEHVDDDVVKAMQNVSSASAHRVPSERADSQLLSDGISERTSTFGSSLEFGAMPGSPRFANNFPTQPELEAEASASAHDVPSGRSSCLSDFTFEHASTFGSSASVSSMSMHGAVGAMQAGMVLKEKLRMYRRMTSKPECRPFNDKQDFFEKGGLDWCEKHGVEHGKHEETIKEENEEDEKE
eukprot:TRINITY_DN24659_c0_g5_i1.p1 TRINITY_DN24659_c0_g5~~TRINITY_DN24659_c0_g5_i1.p1  ORF type:complete len:517 (+),score=70.16 TRINITY_DN24659_c0_g5_i1:41-1591(+)